jgi:hypothetical protein
MFPVYACAECGDIWRQPNRRNHHEETLAMCAHAKRDRLRFWPLVFGRPRHGPHAHQLLARQGVYVDDIEIHDAEESATTSGFHAQIENMVKRGGWSNRGDQY